MPPYLAGREAEQNEFRRLLAQDTILENLVLTGLRGVGKTVLLETFKPLALQEKWLWAGADLSEATSISEVNLITRIITDLSIVTSGLTIQLGARQRIGFERKSDPIVRPVTYQYLSNFYDNVPGLPSDKIRAVLEHIWTMFSPIGYKGLIFAYDEAQNLSDHAERHQFPLSILLDVFQSIQRKGIPFMLVMVGLPTLFPKLVEARTFAERMFRVMFLGQLDRISSTEAVTRPIEDGNCPITFDDPSVATIVELSGGYPYFIQFICREVYDVWIQRTAAGQALAIPVDEITRKLDTDFFAGRWARATDRQRQLLYVIAKIENESGEFSVQEVVEMSEKLLEKGFSNSHASQMLVTLADSGLVYKNRYGRYCFAVPLMAQFIIRQHESGPLPLFE